MRPFVKDWNTWLTPDELAARTALHDSGYRVCRKCRKTKPLNDFCKHPTLWGGRNTRCRACIAEGYQESKSRSVFVSSDYGAIRAAAEKRGLKFAINRPDLEALWSTLPDTCAYCGQGPTEVSRLAELCLKYDGPNRSIPQFVSRFKWCYHRHRTIKRLTIDRRDNEGDYTAENIVKACMICNYLKGSILTEEEMRYLAPRVWSRVRAALGQ